MAARAPKAPRVEMVAGRRVETVEYGLRTATDNVFHRRGHVEGSMSSLERALDCRERPFCGRRGDEQVVTRTILTYTTDWTVVPGHDGSPHLSCNHPDTPQGRPGDNMFTQGPDYQLPHAFRQRDMTPGEDGHLRYTCPVCGLTWRLRDDSPDKPAENMPADIPAAEPLLTLF
jgi:hypothetical protein